MNLTKKRLFRGDTYAKGEEFKSKPDYFMEGRAKNAGKWHFFTDKKAEAIIYATEEMNPKLRKDKKNPHLTIIEVKEANMLDLRDSFGNHRVLSKIDKELYNGEMSFDMMVSYIFGSLKQSPNNYARLQTRNQVCFAYQELKETGVTKSGMSATDLSNFEFGRFFKKILKTNGYDGYLFEDTCSRGAHYAFVDNKKFCFVSQTPINKIIKSKKISI